MDLIVDILVYLFKQLAKSAEPKVRPPTPQEVAAQQAAMRQRLEAMQQALAAQQARTQPKPPARRAAGMAKQTAPARASLSQSPRNGTTPMPSAATLAPLESSPRKRPAPPPGLRMPLILGEILAPPLALREPEH